MDGIDPVPVELIARWERLMAGEPAVIDMAWLGVVNG